MQRTVLLFTNKAADTKIFIQKSRVSLLSQTYLYGLADAQKKEGNCHFW